MTGPGVSDADMPSFRWPARRDESALTDESLAALLAGAQPPEDAPPELRPALDVLAALRAQPGRDELLDEAAALAEFRIRAARPGPASQAWRRRPARLLPSLSAKIAAATAVIALAVGGVAAAAVVGVLPAPFQRLAHDASSVFRPAGSHHSKQKTGMTTGAARGPHGAAALCAAYARAQAGGAQAGGAQAGGMQTGGSVARRARISRELATRAHGADRIAAYCARHGHRPIASVPIAPRHHVRCAPIPAPSRSMHPRPSWTPTVRPSAWSIGSGMPTGHPVLDPTRCGLRWHWSRWHLRHRYWTGGQHPSPSPSAPPRTGQPGHHHVRAPIPHPGHGSAPRPTRQPAPGHTTSRPTAHSSKPALHAARPVKTAAHSSQPALHAARPAEPGPHDSLPAQRNSQSGQSAQLSGTVRT
jgi:hypothetical protein